MMGVKLRSAWDLQIIYSNAGKQFFKCKHNSKTLGKLLSISQIVLIQFLNIVWTKSGNWTTLLTPFSFVYIVDFEQSLLGRIFPHS